MSDFDRKKRLVEKNGFVERDEIAVADPGQSRK